MANDILASVIIPCRNERKNIGECIDAILNQQGVDISAIEIIVVDADSNDGTREFIEATYSQRVRIVRNERLYAPFAFNLGIKAANGRYVIIDGARNIMSPNYIAENLAILENDKQIACVGGYPENVYENDISRAISAAMASKVGVGFSNFRTLRESTYVDTIGTPTFRKNVFDEVGYFDEQLVRNQDDEFSYRLTKAGYKIWLNANVFMKYYVRASFGKLFKQYFQYGYWKVFVNLKHKTFTTIRQLVPAAFVAFLLFGFPALSMLKLGVMYPYILLFYLFVVICGAVYAAYSVKSVFSITIAILILHLSYGLGYLKGIWDFILLRRNPSESAKTLSR